MTEYTIKFEPDIQGLEEAVGPFGMIFKDKYESILLSMGVMIWNTQCEISNNGVIERFNEEWEAAHGKEFGDAYENAFNKLTEELTRKISEKYPIKMPMGRYIVLLRDGTECINFKPPVEGELHGTGIIKMRLERVDS